MVVHTCAVEHYEAAFQSSVLLYAGEKCWPEPTMRTSVIIMYSYWVNQQWWTIIIATKTLYGIWGFHISGVLIVHKHIQLYSGPNKCPHYHRWPLFSGAYRAGFHCASMVCASGTKLVEGVLLECGQSLISTFAIPSGSQQQLRLSSLRSGWARLVHKTHMWKCSRL